MTVLKCLAAATVVVSCAFAAMACDDFDEEMKMAAAYEAAKLARTQATQQASGQAATTSEERAARTGVASIDLPQSDGSGSVSR